MKKKKKLRGMTLVEIIIAIAVFAMISLILVMLGTSVDTQQRSAIKVNNKVAIQGPIAEAQDKDNAYLMDDEFEIKVSKKGAASSSVVVKGKLYSTQGYTIKDGKQVPDANADKANLKFVEIENPLE